MFDLADRDWSERVLEIVGLGACRCSRRSSSPGTVVGEVTDGGGRRDGHARGNAGRRRRCRHAARPARHRCPQPGRFTVVGGTFWQHTVVLDQPLIDPRRAPAHALPHRPRPVDDRGDRLLLRLVDALVPRRVLRAEKARGGARGVDVYDLLERAAAAVPPGSNGVLGIFSNVMDASRWIHASPAFVGFDIGDPGARPARTSASGRSRRPRPTSRAATCGILEEIAGPHVDEIVFTGGAAERRPVAADPRRRARRPRARAGGQGVDGARRRDLRRASAAGIYATLDDGLTGWCGSSAPSSPTRSRWRPTTSCTSAGSRPIARALELAEDGVVRPLWRAAGT